MPDLYKFELDQGIPLKEAEDSLQLSMIALEGLAGCARVRLECSYQLDQPARAILVDGATELGLALVRIYTWILTREFGEDSFQVSRVSSMAKAGNA